MWHFSSDVLIGPLTNNECTKYCGTHLIVYCCGHLPCYDTSHILTWDWPLCLQGNDGPETRNRNINMKVARCVLMKVAVVSVCSAVTPDPISRTQISPTLWYSPWPGASVQTSLTNQSDVAIIGGGSEDVCPADSPLLADLPSRWDSTHFTPWDNDKVRRQLAPSPHHICLHSYQSPVHICSCENNSRSISNRTSDHFDTPHH